MCTAARAAWATTLFLTAVAAYAGPAAATVVATPSLQKADSQYFNCRVLNLGKKQISVTLEIRSSSGGALSSLDRDVNPGWTESVSYFDSASIGYCVVTGKFSKKKILATFCVTNVTSECFTAVSAP